MQKSDKVYRLQESGGTRKFGERGAVFLATFLLFIVIMKWRSKESKVGVFDTMNMIGEGEKVH